MSPPSTFATYFARLIAQRVHEPNNIDAHRAALADLLAANQADVTLSWDNWQLRSGSDVFDAASPGMIDLLSRMAAHGVRELSFGAGTERAHLLGVAWILCQDPALGDGGARAVSRLSMLGASGVRMVPVVAPTVSATPETEARVVVSVEPAPPPVAAAPPPVEATSTPVEPPPAPAPRAPRESVAFLTARRLEQRDTADVLIARLAEAKTPEQIARALDALAAFTELPRKRITDVVAILTAMLAEEPRLTHEEAKRMFGFALKRIAKSSTFRAMAAALAAAPENHDDYVRIFKYFGDAAADQVIEQLAHADSLKERRVLFDTLVELQRGVPTLIYLLGDGRWYVVRNAAELLGEMRALEAEQGLAWLVNHPDERVRRSATAALAKLDTPGARAALREAIKDTSPDVRMNALLALSNGDKKRVATQIIRALPEERDPDTQKTLMIILARLGTPEAIQYLLNAAEPEKGFFKKKPTPTRVAAVAALADAADPTALAAIRAMTKDKEREVRDAAARALPPAKAKASTMTPPDQSW
jgi:HEAT repeat protein